MADPSLGGTVVGSYLPSMKWAEPDQREAAEALLRLETATPLAAKLDARRVGRGHKTMSVPCAWLPLYLARGNSSPHYHASRLLNEAQACFPS